MRRFISPAIVLCALALCACDAPEPPALQGNINGTWQGERWDGRARVLWTTVQSDDGRIEIEFITCFNGEVLSRENQYGTATLTEGYWVIDLDHVEYRDLRSGETTMGEGFDSRYEFLEISDERLRYRAENSGTRFEVVKASVDARQSCPPARITVDTDPGERVRRDAWISRGVGYEDEEDDADDATPEPDAADDAG
ncbi:MAG: hypothetical protein AAFU65_05735 [Pseudomonadota bacterium]